RARGVPCSATVPRTGLRPVLLLYVAAQGTQRPRAQTKPARQRWHAKVLEFKTEFARNPPSAHEGGRGLGGGRSDIKEEPRAKPLAGDSRGGLPPSRARPGPSRRGRPPTPRRQPSAQRLSARPRPFSRPSPR